MPKLVNQNPSYRLHKASGQAVVVLNGQTFYLGVHGTEASRREYDRLLSEWIANGRQIQRNTEAGITIAELVNMFRKHVEVYYVKDGAQTSEVVSFRYAMKPVLKLYADLPACDFGPLKLKAVRQEMVSMDWVRTSINRQIGRVRQMFKWGVENELIPASVHHGLMALAGLRKGRQPGVAESDPVRPVPDAYIDAVKPYVTSHVWGMIQMQRYTGVRPGEVTAMRGCDLNTSGAIWEYRPASHKTQHHGRERVIAIGPQAQMVLKPFLRPNLAEYLFNPREAHAERRAASAHTRRRPNQKPTRRRTRRMMGDSYDVLNYGRAIRRACELANATERKKRRDARPDDVLVPKWHPNQLRHSYATAVRKRFGIEAARAALGHASAVVTELYAEVDFQKAALVAAEVG